jgi:hypothetical protein
VNVAAVILVAAALAAVAIAKGSAAATSTAPAARAFTMLRGIHLKVFITNPSLVVVFIFPFTPFIRAEFVSLQFQIMRHSRMHHKVAPRDKTRPFP